MFVGSVGTDPVFFFGLYSPPLCPLFSFCLSGCSWVRWGHRWCRHASYGSSFLRRHFLARMRVAFNLLLTGWSAQWQCAPCSSFVSHLPAVNPGDGRCLCLRPWCRLPSALPDRAPLCCIFSLLLLQTADLHILIPCTVEPRYNEVLGTIKISLLYQGSHCIRVKKQRNIKSWDQQNYLVIRGFCYIRPLYNEVPLVHCSSLSTSKCPTWTDLFLLPLARPSSFCPFQDFCSSSTDCLFTNQGPVSQRVNLWLVVTSIVALWQKVY